MAHIGYKVTINGRKVSGYKDVGVHLSNMLDNLKKTAEEAKVELSTFLAKTIAPIILEEIQERFDSETDPSGRKWASLSDETLKYKARYNYPLSILQRTQNMMGSFRILNVTNTSLEVGTDITDERGKHYPKYHQGKTANIPQREILGWNEKMRTNIMTAMQVFTNRLTEKMKGGRK